MRDPCLGAGITSDRLGACARPYDASNIVGVSGVSTSSELASSFDDAFRGRSAVPDGRHGTGHALVTSIVTRVLEGMSRGPRRPARRSCMTTFVRRRAAGHDMLGVAPEATTVDVTAPRLDARCDGCQLLR